HVDPGAARDPTHRSRRMAPPRRRLSVAHRGARSGPRDHVHLGRRRRSPRGARRRVRPGSLVAHDRGAAPGARDEQPPERLDRSPQGRRPRQLLPHAVRTASTRVRPHDRPRTAHVRRGERRARAAHRRLSRRGSRTARSIMAVMLVAQYVPIAYLVAIGFFTPLLLVVFLALPKLLPTLRILRATRPATRPADYPERVWPGWFVAYAFVHNRRWGSLFL